MDPDDQVCLCYRVSLHKIRGFLAREDPEVASLISECLDAGTGCGWCVPFLKKLHADHKAGRVPDIKGSPEEYANLRQRYRSTGERPTDPSDASSADESS